jgi:hypothetical protein
MAIGVNQVEYSPTSTTGWYAGISPPLSGYTVYVNKVSQGPSILVASNDNDLVSIARSQGATSTVTTTAGALNYFASQSDMMVVNKNYNDIVISGLVMNWDASFVASYPVSGTSWYDISGSGNTGTLNNGPTFNSSGYFVFDGTDDSVSRTYNSTFNIRSGITLCALFRRNSIFTQLSDCFILSRPPAWYFYDEYNAGTIRGDVFIDGTRRGNRSVSMPNDGRWYEFVYTYDSSTGWAIMYRNGVSASSTQVTGLSNYLIDSSNANFQSIFLNNVGKSYFVNNLKIYNRALSASEIQQNYYGGSIVTSGLTLAVDAGNLVSFQNGSGSTFSLVGSYTGALQNGVSYTIGGGGSWDFDGSDDWISIPTYTFGNGGWACNVWVQGDSVTYSTTGNIISNSSGGPVTNAMGFLSSKIHYRNYDGAWKSNSGNTTLTAGQWYMLTWVNYSGATAQQGTMKMFVNGNVDSSVFNSYTTNGGPCDAIGRNWFSYFDGRIGLVQFYNKSLTDVEVTQNFNAQKRRFGF